MKSLSSLESISHGIQEVEYNKIYEKAFKIKDDKCTLLIKKLPNNTDITRVKIYIAKKYPEVKTIFTSFQSIIKSDKMEQADLYRAFKADQGGLKKSETIFPAKSEENNKHKTFNDIVVTNIRKLIK